MLTIGSSEWFTGAFLLLLFILIIETAIVAVVSYSQHRSRLNSLKPLVGDSENNSSNSIQGK